jgi:hypothetical protein
MSNGIEIVCEMVCEYSDRFPSPFPIGMAFKRLKLHFQDKHLLKNENIQ